MQKSKDYQAIQKHNDTVIVNLENYSTALKMVDEVDHKKCNISKESLERTRDFLKDKISSCEAKKRNNDRVLKLIEENNGNV